MGAADTGPARLPAADTGPARPPAMGRDFGQVAP
jgi:hypothetical protein